jgi:hypothetical protein
MEDGHWWKRGGAHHLRVVRAMRACGSVIAAAVAGAGDGTLVCEVLRVGGVRRSRKRAGWYGPEDRCGKRGVTGRWEKAAEWHAGGASCVRGVRQVKVLSRGRHGRRR